MTREDRIMDLAARLVDRRPIDWESETGDDEMSTQILNLRMLERIRSLHLGDPDVDRERSNAEATPTPTRPLAGDEAGPARPTRQSTGLHPGARWGSLELEELVGSGSYGEVWRAWDPTLQTHVGLKLLFPRARRTEEILHEARQMAKVRHENVVRVHGAAVHGGRVGIWYSFILGRTLERQLEERGPMGPSEAAVVGIDLLHAMAAVHAAGLVHRDIKTSNVMREDGGRIILMDFGTVVNLDSLESLSATDAFTGTAPYMAPEIFDGKRPSVASDIYALGVLLYRLVSDRYPQPKAAGRPQRPGETTPLRDARPDLPAAFVRIVERAMATDPAARYASAGEMERDVAAFLSGESGTASVPRPVRARRAWRALFAVPALAAAVWLAWDLAGGHPLQVDAALFREGRGAEERLQPGGRVRLRDQLFLELEATRDAWVYVFNQDELGNVYTLFPIEGLEPSNPIRRGATVRLPGFRNGEEQRWDVTSVGGEEAFFVIASRERLPDLEEELKKAPQAGSGAAVLLPPERLRRGLGGLSPAPTRESDEVPSLSGMFEGILARAEGDGGLWAWSIHLENPAP